MNEKTHALELGRFYWSAEEREKLEQKRGLSTEQLLRSLVEEIQERALVPVSSFRVGAAALNSVGEVFLGLNMEFAGVSFAQTVHAEQFLVSLSRTRSSAPLTLLAVSAPPCGHCRQFVAEFDTAGELELLIGQEPGVKMGELLPRAFGPADLKVEESFYSEPLNLQGVTDAEEAARLAARHSYVPYSGTRAGTAVRSDDGRLFAGAAIENAAYNPALPPLQAALISAYAEGYAPDRIETVVLCQGKGALIDYEPQIKDLTQALGSGSVKFKTIYLDPGVGESPS